MASSLNPLMGPPSSMGPPTMMGPPSSMGPPSAMGPPSSNGPPSGMGPPSSMPFPFVNGHPLAASPPPPGVMPNLVNPVSRAQDLIIANAILLSVTTMFVLMRFYTRIFISRALGWDDYVCAIAMLFSYAYSAMVLRMISYGYGKHLWDVPFEDFIPQFPRYLVFSAVLHAVLIFLVKVCILLLYLRLFGASRKMKIAIYVTGILTLAYSIAGTVYGIVRSIPVFRSMKQPMMQPNQSRDWFLTTWGIMNVLTDFLVLVLPVPTVWGLNISKKQKLALLGIFMTGTFTCVVSIIRLRAYTAVSQSEIIDLTWALVPWGCWNVVEANVGISCACTACLKPLVKKIAPNLLSLSRSRGTGKGTGDSGASSNRTWTNKPLDSSYLELGSRQGNHKAYINSSSRHDESNEPPPTVEYGAGMGIVKTVGVNIRAVEKGDEER